MIFPVQNNLSLSQSDLLDDPMAQLKDWWQKALDFGEHVNDAACLATCGQDLWPDARMVLIKEIKQTSVVFFTNYKSNKAQQLGQNPRATLVIFWPTMQRQIRLQGNVVKTSFEESEKYFQSRPKGSQIAAWASHQSTPVKNRKELEEKYVLAQSKYNSLEKIPCPPFWGGFELVPRKIEFWQNKSNRLHDRFCYTLVDSQKWAIARLCP